MFYTIVATYLFIGIMMLGIILALVHRKSTWTEFISMLRLPSFWVASIMTTLLWPTIVCSVVPLIFVEKYFNTSKERG